MGVKNIYTKPILGFPWWKNVKFIHIHAKQISPRYKKYCSLQISESDTWQVVFLLQLSTGRLKPKKGKKNKYVIYKRKSTSVIICPIWINIKWNTTMHSIHCQMLQYFKWCKVGKEINLENRFFKILIKINNYYTLTGRQGKIKRARIQG